MSIETLLERVAESLEALVAIHKENMESNKEHLAFHVQCHNDRSKVESGSVPVEKATRTRKPKGEEAPVEVPPVVQEAMKEAEVSVPTPAPVVQKPVPVVPPEPVAPPTTVNISLDEFDEAPAKVYTKENIQVMCGKYRSTLNGTPKENTDATYDVIEKVCGVRRIADIPDNKINAVGETFEKLGITSA